MPNEDYKLPPFQDSFKVPDGYFDTLTERIMEKIPEESASEKAVSVNMWRRYSFRAAAAVALVVIGIGTYSLFQKNETYEPRQQTAAVAEKQTNGQSAEAIDQVADYIMCDNHDLYAYLSGE